MKITKTLLPGLLVITWMMVALLGYTYGHKPFTPEQLLRWLTLIWQTTCAGLLVCLAGGIGARLLPEALPVRPLTKAVFQAALGMGVLALLTLTVGAFSTHPAVLGGMILALSAFTWREIKTWLTHWKDLQAVFPDTRFSAVLAIGNALILGCTFLVAGAPPLHFDALSYHLTLPQGYLSGGQITYHPENVFWGMPQLTEMLYLLVMAFSGLQAGPLLGWMLGSLALVGLLSHVGERFGVESGWVAVTALTAGETLANALAWGYVDWVALLYGFVVFISLEHWQHALHARSLAVAGIFAGLALSVKYTAGIVLIAGLVVILFSRYSLRQRLAAALLFGSLAVLAFSPWLLKNLAATGNPVYPLFFPAGEMDANRILKYHFSPPDANWLRLLTLPWDITVFGVEGGAGFSASIGALLLGLSPFALLAFLRGQARLGLEQQSLMSTAWQATLGSLLFFATASQVAGLLGQTRLYFGFFSAWAMLAAGGYFLAANLPVSRVRFKPILQAILLMAFAFTLMEVGPGFAVKNTSGYLLSPAPSTARYLENNLGNLYRAMQALENLPDGSRVLLLWEPRSLYCQPHCDGDEIIDRWYADWRELRDLDQIEARWREEGFTHVLYYRLGSDFIRENETRKYNPADWAGLDAMLEKLGSPVAQFGQEYDLYEIK